MMRLLGGDHSVSERQAHLSIDRICLAPGQNGSIKADLVAHRQRARRCQGTISEGGSSSPPPSENSSSRETTGERRNRKRAEPVVL